MLCRDIFDKRGHLQDQMIQIDQRSVPALVCRPGPQALDDLTCTFGLDGNLCHGIHQFRFATIPVCKPRTQPLAKFTIAESG